MARKISIDIYQNLMQELRSEDLKPVYFFCGEEDFFLDNLQEAIEEKVPADQKDFNFDLIYGQDATVDKVLSIIRSFPMMAERRVVIVRDTSSLRNTTAEGESGGSLNDLIPYLEQPNPSTLLVLIDAKKPHGNTKFGKAVQKNSNVGFYEFDEVKDYTLPEWIIEWTQTAHQKRMSPDAANLMAQYVGNSLQLLSSEIDKLCTYKDTSDVIQVDDVKKVIGLYREFSGFELKDAVMDRDLDQSLYIAEQMLQSSKSDTGEVIKTVGLFYNVFSNVWQIRRLQEKGETRNQIQQAMGINNSWYFKNLWSDASKYQLAEMPRVFEAILDADRAIKGFSTMDPTTIFLLMIKRIIN